MRNISTIFLVVVVMAAIATAPAVAGEPGGIPPGWNPFAGPVWFNQAPPVFEFEIKDTAGEMLYFTVEHEYLELGNAKVFQSVEPEGWTIVVIPSKRVTGANADLRW